MNLRTLDVKNKLKGATAILFRRSESEPREGSRLYVLWLWSLPILLGVTLGWFAMTCAGVLLDGFYPSAVELSAPSGLEKPQDGEEDRLSAFLASNPFRISPMPALTPPEKQVSEVVATGSLASATLRGTLPGVAALLEDRGQDRFVLVGTSFDSFTLETVTGHRAVFVASPDRVVKELLYGGPSSSAKSPGSLASPAALPGAPLPVGNVVPASDGSVGELPSGLVSQLVENPFEELKRVRLRPTKEGTGLQIEWIQQDSILSRLGVREGDVVKGINGIPFRNMADIANSINSLMNSERFDVEVTRDGKATSLQYVVH
ncbi:MAG: hypothetical protein GX256_02350 [Fretibacterium sp.]|nr:hypothetical protein [Fretibacterium sp.]